MKMENNSVMLLYLPHALPSFDWPHALVCPVANQMLTIDFRRYFRTYRLRWAKQLSTDAIPVGSVSDCPHSIRPDPISIAEMERNNQKRK